MQLIFIAIGAALLWFWWNSSGASEKATQAAKRACKESGVQFLDDTVSMRKTRLQRNEMGHVNLARLYSFEFSLTGDHRHFGYVITLGDKIFKIELEKPYTENEGPTAH